jgi:hypothetical protein
VLAQAVGSSLSGSVRDPGGRLVPNVVVGATSLDTGATWTTASDGFGRYAFG